MEQAQTKKEIQKAQEILNKRIKEYSKLQSHQNNESIPRFGGGDNEFQNNTREVDKQLFMINEQNRIKQLEIDKADQRLKIVAEREAEKHQLDILK